MRRFAGALAPYVVIVALTLGGGELIGRALGIRPLTTESLLWRDHPRWGWFHQAGAEDLFVKPGFSQRVRINERGLRERPIPYEKPAGLFRVLVVGDSSVVSFEVAPEDVFTRLAEDRLRELGYPVQFVNGGVRGYGTDQALLFLEEEGLRYEPDLVLYKWTNNDDEDNATVHRPFRRYGKPWFGLDDAGDLVLRGVPVPRYPYPANLRVDEDGEVRELEVGSREVATLWLRDHVLCRSAFGTGLLKVALSLPGMVRPLMRMGSYNEADDVPSALDRDSHLFRVTAALVRRMERSSREAGAAFRMIGAEGSWGEALLETTGLPDLGVTRTWQARRPPDRPVHVPYDPHWNELGHRLYAEALVEALRETDLLPAPTGAGSPGA